MDFPDRLAPLLAVLEAGQPLTPELVKRTATLQELTLAKFGEDFARSVIKSEEQQTEALRKAMEE